MDRQLKGLGIKCLLRLRPKVNAAIVRTLSLGRSMELIRLIIPMRNFLYLPPVQLRICEKLGL